MTITDRDKKILAVLAVLGVLAGYWFLVLSPKREEVAKVDEEIATQEQQRDAARSQLQAAQAAQASFAGDYAEMVRLGKAIPSTVDMPSLLVQLDRAADGTHIDVDKITVGARVPATGGSTPAATPPPADGGDPAASQTDTQTSQSARDGSVPVGGGSAGGSAAPASGSGSGVAGLDAVPIEFGFTGSYFDLADFFHRLKRFVHVGKNGIVVRGRLMTIDSFTFGADDGGERGGSDDLSATLKATVYLAPEGEGATAGATPSGPAPQPAESASSSSSAPPTATVQP